MFVLSFPVFVFHFFCCIVQQTWICRSSGQLKAKDAPRTVLLDLACHHHLGALCAKPVVTRLCSGALTSCYIRLAHLLESSRTFTNYLEALDATVNEIFRYRAVLVLPPESHEHQQRSRRLLESTRVALDLSQDDINEAVSFDNSNWDDDEMTHYCTPECSCHGDERAARERARNVCRRLHGNGVAVPLLYRFKHMERTAAQICRSRHHHRLLDKTLQRMYPEAARRQAAAEAAAYQGDGDMPFNLKQGVRANKVLHFFDHQDKDRLGTRQAHLLPSPLHYYLNFCFKAECEVNTVTHALSVGMVGDDLAELADAAFRANAKVISGEIALEVQYRFAEVLLNWDAPVWRDLQMSEEETYHSCLQMMCAMGEAWRRLSLVAEYDTRYRLFSACHIRGMKVYDHDHILRVVRPIQAMQVACDTCIDQEFTAKLAPVLVQRSQDSLDVHGMLCSALTILRASSSIVERAHLPSEEAKPTRSRGRAFCASSLAGHTYRRYVENEHRARHRHIQDEVLKLHGLSKVQFSSYLRGGQVGTSSSNSTRAAPKGFGTHRKLAAVDIFRREQWDTRVRARIGSPEHLAEQARVLQSWARLPQAQRSQYEQRAATANAELDRVRTGGHSDDVDALGLRPGQRFALLRDVARAALREIVDHPGWALGLGISSHASGLAEHHVSLEPQASIEARLARKP